MTHRERGGERGVAEGAPIRQMRRLDVDTAATVLCSSNQMV